jgi:hypothetical protein
LIASIACGFVVRKLDPSVGRSGPHDLAVRENAFVGVTCALSIQASTASPPPYVRDDRDTPLHWRRDGQRIIIIF